MGLIIAFIILAIIVYTLHKMNFATRIKIAVVFLIMLGIRHAYVAITSVEDDDVNDAITEYIEKCNTIYDEQLSKNIAVTIFSEAAANASTEPVNKVKSRLYSGYLIKTGQGGISDVFNYFPAYIAENYLGFNFEEDIKQIGKKAGISAVEEAECQQPTTNKSTSIKEENVDHVESKNIQNEEKNISQSITSEERSAANNDYSYSEEWKNIQNEIKDNPEKFVSDCIDTEIKIAQEAGGMSREDILSGGVEDSCRKELSDFKNCMNMNINEGEHCYTDLVKDRDI